MIAVLAAGLKVQEADRLGIPVYDHVPALKITAQKMIEELNINLEEAR